MVEAIPPAVKKPGVVIFVAILNFVSVAFWLAGTLFSILFLSLGQAVDLFQRTVTQLNQTLTSAGLSIGLTLVCAVVMFVCAVFALFHALLAVGLLKGHKAAWYLQLVSSTFGLLFLPYGTVLSVVILIFFFRAPVRDFFKT